VSLVSFVVATFAAPLFGAADAVDRTSRLVPVGEAADIRVDATIADVTLTAADRADVRIDVERHAPTRDDFARFPVAIDATDRVVRLSVLQRDDGRDGQLKTTVAISAPVSAVFSAVHVFEGRVRLHDVRSAADIAVDRGTIDATHVAGRVRLSSELGGIDVRDAELTPNGAMRLRVFNGPLRVRFAAQPVNARILAVTLNGSIVSDIPLTRRDKFGPRFGETTIGSGDPVLSMDVVKGDITLAVGK
jgi:hypothetical protein